MRNIFVDEIRALMREDPQIVFVSAECGFNVVEGMAEEFPNRFYNVGIAEQSLVGTTAGIAIRGMKPVAYTMGMFLSMRAYEQIRVDVAYQNLPVVLASVIPGLGYGNSGTTHHSIEDTALMRVLPNMTVIYTSCEEDVRFTCRQVMKQNGPCYIGLGRNPGNYHAKYCEEEFYIGKAIQVLDGNDAAIFSTGVMVQEALNVADILKRSGINMRVYNMHTIKPLDVGAIIKAVNECGFIFSLEEENIIGGLGGAMAEFLAENSQLQYTFRRFGVPDTYGTSTGSINWLRKQYGIDSESVAESIRNILKGV